MLFSFDKFITSHSIMIVHQCLSLKNDDTSIMVKQLGWALKLPRTKRVPCQALSPGVEYLSNIQHCNSKFIILSYHISMTRVK